MVTMLDPWSSYLSATTGQSNCCVLGQNTSFVQCLSPPRSINRCQQLSGKPDEMQEGNIVMD